MAPTNAIQRVDVRAEDGRVCAIEFEHRRPGFWSIDVSDCLIARAPQAIAAAIGIALSQMTHCEECDYRCERGQDTPPAEGGGS